MSEIGTKDRLHGARLAAGFVYLKDAAEVLGAHEATYRHAESGVRSTSQSILERAARAFDVSTGYLQGADAATVTEALAHRLAVVLRDVDVDQYESPVGYAAVLERLRMMRTATGHETTNAAAEAHGWNRTVYWQHESGGRGMTLDRLIAYCLAIGARPEFGVLGREPMLESGKPEWSERARVRHEASTDPAPGR